MRTFSWSVTKWLVVVAAAALLIAAPFHSAALGGTVNSSWDGGTGNWSAAGDWTPTTVPNNGGGNVFNVTIDSGGTDNVTLDISPTIASLVLGGSTGSSTLANKSGTAETLTITGALTVNTTGSLLFANGSTVTAGANSTNFGLIDLEQASKLSITGNLSNSGMVETNRSNGTGGANILTVTGAFTNSATGQFIVGNFDDTTDVANVGTLSNSGFVYIGKGATLNLTNQASGITDILSGSRLQVAGTFKAGANNALANLNSIEGELDLENGQSTTATPGSGTLTVSSSGILDVEGFSGATTLTISGNLTNSNLVETNRSNNTNNGNNTTNSSTFTVTGAFTNNATGQFIVGNFDDTHDVANVATLSNSGFVYIGKGATLNLTSQPSGITDVVSGSRLQVSGTFKAGANNALANLNSIEGELDLENGQSTTATPGSGTLTVSSSGILDVEGFSGATTLTISGNLTNSNLVETNRSNNTNNGNNTTNSSTFTVTGAFTNNATGQFIVGNFDDTHDVANVATLSNSGFVYIGKGATLNLTSQPSGITDVVSGSRLQVSGTFKAGANNALANLNSIEGELDLENGQSTTATPGSGTLTVSSSGILDVEGFSGATTLTISGNLTNSNLVETNRSNNTNNGNNTTNSSTFTVTGAFTNNATGQFIVGNFNDTLDVANVATLSNSGFVYIGTGATLNLTNQASGITDILSGSRLQVSGTFKAGANNALASLNSIEGELDLENGQSTTATPGSGTLTVSSSGILDVEGFSGATTLTISGKLTNSGLVETNRSNFTNNGNNGTNSSTFTVTDLFTNNATGQFIVGNFNDTHDVANVGTLSNSGTATVGTGATLTITTAGTLTNSGAINLGSNLGGATLKIDGNVTLSGKGTVTLANAGGNIIEGLVGTDTLTNKDNTIQGSGNIGNNSMALNNQGTINANQVLAPLIIQASNGTSNSGTMEATSGATLQLDAGTYTQTGKGTIEATGTGSLVLLESGVIINGGTLTTAKTSGLIETVVGGATTLNGVVNSGTFQVSDTSTLTLQGINTNTGTINVGDASGAATLSISGNVSLNGTGKVTLSNNAGNLITGSSGNVLTNANTIQGAGNIGNALISVVNNGTISANQSNPLIIDTNSTGLTNNGTLSVSAHDTLDIEGGLLTNFNSGTSTLTGGTYSVSGTLQLMNTTGTITTDAASITMTGATAKFLNSTGGSMLTNLNTIATGGTFGIASGFNFTTAGNFTNNGTLNIGNGTKFEVNLANSLTNFSGTTLTGGTYIDSGTLQFAGANIVTIAAGTSLTMSGASAKIEDQTGAADGLTNFATNNGTFAIATGFNFTTAGNFTNNGTLSIGTGTKFEVNLANSLTNFSGTTLTGGTYIDSGTLQFAGANIQTIAAGTSLTMSGATAKIEDQTGAADGLTNLATNNGTFAIASGFNFTTVGNFTNNGTLSIGTGTKFATGTNSLTNFSGTTLTGGTYNVTGTLEFNGANIVTNAANITLTGTSSQIINQSNANGLANFATNNGSFALAGNRSFTTVGSFANAGTFTINKGSTFSLGGSGVFTQSGGTTTDDGSLSAASGGVSLQGGLLFGTGSITGAVASSSAGTINPGDSSTATGILKDTGTYTQNSGTLDISIEGTTAGTQFDQLNPTKATLSGTLNISRPTGFVPNIGNTFKIMNFTSETGTFATVNGLAINGTEHFTITYQPTDVLLTVVSGAFSGAFPTGQHAFNVGTISASSFTVVEHGFGPTVVAQLNGPATVPEKGFTFELLLMALFGCALFHWHSTSQRRPITTTRIRRRTK